MGHNALMIISWVAVVLLSLGYWLQVWKIYIHKEVRDISLAYTILLAIGFGALGFTAAYEGSAIFLVKQVATFVPVCVIIFQVIYHRDSTWHDRRLPECRSCGGELEKRWKNCPYCGAPRKAKG